MWGCARRNFGAWLFNYFSKEDANARFYLANVLQSLIMHKAGGRRTVGGPSTPIRSQTSIRNFLGKEVIVN